MLTRPTPLDLTCWPGDGPGPQGSRRLRRPLREPRRGSAGPTETAPGNHNGPVAATHVTGHGADHGDQRDLGRATGPRDRPGRAPAGPAVRRGLGQGGAPPDHPDHRRRGHRHLGGLPAARPAARGDPVDPHRRLHRPRPQPVGQLPAAAPVPAGQRRRRGPGRRRVGLRRPARPVGLPTGELADPRGRTAPHHGRPGPKGPRLAGPHPPEVPSPLLGPEERPQAEDGGQPPRRARPSTSAPTWPKGVLSTLLAITTIAFLTLFMLLAGPQPAAGLPRQHADRPSGDGGGHRPPGVEVGDRPTCSAPSPCRCSSGWWSSSPCSSWGFPSPSSSGCGWPWWP